jgi:hypothetical protein
MKTRSIPPLGNDDDDDDDDMETRLVHVTAIIRHGARTPTHGNHPCWNGYWGPPHGVWDCNLTTRISTSVPPTTDQGSGMVLLEKVYDALISTDDSLIYNDNRLVLKNNLNGTCQAGQLVQQGYDQQQANGKFLRDAYIYDGGEELAAAADPRMRLFDVSTSTLKNDDRFPFETPFLRFRSDEDQRTMASGQVLLSEMFRPELAVYRQRRQTNPMIPLHTADRSQDTLSPKGNCVNLQAAETAAEESSDYQAFNNSDESTLLRRMMEKELGRVLTTPIDCLMTAICTDRPLPDVLNDYGKNPPRGNNDNDDVYLQKYGADRFERLVTWVS